MSPEKITSDEFRELMRNKLKEISLSDLEKIIAKAINDELGTEYECTINGIEHINHLKAKFDVSLSPPFKMPFCEPAGPREGGKNSLEANQS